MGAVAGAEAVVARRPEAGPPGIGPPGIGRPGIGPPGSGPPGIGPPSPEARRRAPEGLPGNGLPGNGLPGNGLPGNGLPGNGLGVVFREPTAAALLDIAPAGALLAPTEAGSDEVAGGVALATGPERATRGTAPGSIEGGVDGAVAKTAEWLAREARMLPACVLPRAGAGADAANCAASGGSASIAPPGSRRAAQSGFGGEPAPGGRELWGAAELGSSRGSGWLASGGALTPASPSRPG